MKTARPVNKEAYERWAARISKPSFMHKIPAILAMECECLVTSYYGGPLKTALHLIKKAALHSYRCTKWRAVFWICDSAGWTQLRPIPGCDPKQVKARHSRTCDKLNCDDIDCATRTVPRWFKRLSGLHEFEDL
jgi:hypothetical protein